MAANLEAECYFCGNPNASKRCTCCKVARYCSSKCQAKHWKLGHKEDCRTAAVIEQAEQEQEQEQQDHTSITIHKADYYSYIDTLPGLGNDEFDVVFAYHIAATKDNIPCRVLPTPFFDRTNSCKPSSHTDKTRLRT
jgi:hypothetical protein